MVCSVVCVFLVMPSVITCQGDYVFASVFVSVCLSVSKITQKAMNRFWLGFHGTFRDYTLATILIPMNQDRAVFHSLTITYSTMFWTFGLSLLVSLLTGVFWWLYIAWSSWVLVISLSNTCFILSVQCSWCWWMQMWTQRQVDLVGLKL